MENRSKWLYDVSSNEDQENDHHDQPNNDEDDQEDISDDFVIEKIVSHRIN